VDAVDAVDSGLPSLLLPSPSFPLCPFHLFYRTR
jgi:hypothetical protein